MMDIDFKIPKNIKIGQKIKNCEGEFYVTRHHIESETDVRRLRTWGTTLFITDVGVIRKEEYIELESICGQTKITIRRDFKTKNLICIQQNNIGFIV